MYGMITLSAEYEQHWHSGLFKLRTCYPKVPSLVTSSSDFVRRRRRRRHRPLSLSSSSSSSSVDCQAGEHKFPPTGADVYQLGASTTIWLGSGIPMQCLPGGAEYTDIAKVKSSVSLHKYPSQP